MVHKTKHFNELGDPSPTTDGWVLSLFSLTLGFFWLLWGDLATTGLWYARLQQQFSHLAGEGQQLSKLLDNSKFFPLYEQRHDIFRAFQPVLVTLERGKLSEALQLLDRSDIPKHPLIEKLREKLQGIQSTDKHFQRLSTEETTMSDRSRLLLLEYQGIQEELIYNITGHRNTETVSQLSNGFYDFGLLKDLPIVENVPDNILDLEQLKQFSPRLARVPQREIKLFESVLANLAPRSLQLKEEVSNFFESNSLRSKALGSLGTEREGALHELQRLVGKLMIELTRVSLPARVISAYHHLEFLAFMLGQQAPTLRTSEPL